MTKPAPFQIQDPDISHVIIEIFGGDNNLSGYLMEDIHEIVRGAGGNFGLLAIADFADRGAACIEFTPKAGIKVLEYWGEIDTGNPEVLARFLSRAFVTYKHTPHIALGFWDHGSGVFDEQDPEEHILERSLTRAPRWARTRSRPARRLFFSSTKLLRDPDMRAMLHDDTNGGMLTNREARALVQKSMERAGFQRKLDLLFSDTCLNGMVEVLDQFKDLTEVVVASEELEPGDGWDYYEWLKRMTAAPPTNGEAWGKQAVEAFEAGYSDEPGQHPCTLGAFRTANTITESFRDLIKVLEPHGHAGWLWVLDAIHNTQAFAAMDSYDMRDFARAMRECAEADDVRAACDVLAEAFDAARIHSTALGKDVPDSHGLAFWAPPNKNAWYSVAPTYKTLQFDQATGWSTYLKKFLFHSHS